MSGVDRELIYSACIDFLQTDIISSLSPPPPPRNVALPFRWKLCKPCLRCPRDTTAEVHRTASLSRVPRTGDESGVFSVTPNMGILPAHQTADFSLEFAPIQVKLHNQTRRVTLRNIALHYFAVLFAEISFFQ